MVTRRVSLRGCSEEVRLHLRQGRSRNPLSQETYRSHKYGIPPLPFPPNYGRT